MMQTRLVNLERQLSEDYYRFTKHGDRIERLERTCLTEHREVAVNRADIAKAQRDIRALKRSRATAALALLLGIAAVILGIIAGTWWWSLVGGLSSGVAWGALLAIASSLDEAWDSHAAALERESDRILREAS